MRGADVTQESMFSYATLGEFVPAEHPLRAIREILNTALRALDESFEQLGYNMLSRRFVGLSMDNEPWM